MYLKTKFRKRTRTRNKFAGNKSRKYIRKRTMKRRGGAYKLECTSDPTTKKICCKQIE